MLGQNIEECASKDMQLLGVRMRLLNMVVRNAKHGKMDVFKINDNTLQPHYNTLLYSAHLLITPYRHGSHCLYFLCIRPSL